MRNHRTLLAIGLSSLLSLATLAPAVAGQERGHRQDSGNNYQATTPYLKTDHRRHYRGHNHRPQRKHHRRAYRNDRRYRGDHGHYRNYRQRNSHDFASGLVFGGVLGYIIGNDY